MRFWLALCVRAREGGSGALMLIDLARALLMCVAGVWQATASATQVQWRLPRHWRAGSASWRASNFAVRLRFWPSLALLVLRRFSRAAWFLVGAVRACTGGRQWRVDADRSCACIADVCGWGVADNSIGEAGAAALAKALESGQ